MTKTIKIVIIVLAGVLAFGGAALWGLRSFIRYIYDRRDCEAFNIDNIELHTRVDIPEISTYSCVYSKELNTKLAHFDINKDQVDMDRYIRGNHFKQFSNSIRLDELLVNDIRFGELQDYSDIYYTSGSYHGETWQTLLNKLTGRLWVIIRFKD
ncbi:MAG: hypothetical protein BGO69_15705 [Bacteroidetes bacterium 46-16]|nr:MAG: hypothetical protein BGO69_15705 [Bacteroidetes bacterium 46-16]